MNSAAGTTRNRRTARIVGIVIVSATVVVGAITLERTNDEPRTDDAWVFANLIGIAPQVEGPVTKLYVKDNQLVKAGEVLFEIDPLPYQYALERARSEQQTLEKQIVDALRVIAGQRSAVESARASISTSEAHVSSSEASINAARANVAHAEAGLARAEREYKYAIDNVGRLEPLLTRQFVTVDEVDRARTQQAIAAEAVRQARSQLELTRAQLDAALAQRNQASSGLQQSQAQLQQSVHGVATLEPLTSQRLAKAAAVRNAEYNLSRCRVVAPFDARVTDLTISEGAYARIGERVFTLIDVRTWWIIGNFREGQLKRIRAGMPADVYVMGRPNQRFAGVVESVAYGVTPQEATISGALPQVQRSLNWVHLATRFPVRVRVTNPGSELFRIGESGIVIVRGRSASGR